MKIKLKNGRVQRFPTGVGKVLIARGIGEEVSEEAAQDVPQNPPGQTYQTRMLQADPANAAPYGYKADGTPRKRPGRPASPETKAGEA